MTQTTKAVLHHGDGTRSLRVRWVLEELGVPHEIAPVLFPPRKRQPAYLEVNPLGSLPFFTDGEVACPSRWPSASISWPSTVRHAWRSILVRTASPTTGNSAGTERQP